MALEALGFPKIHNKIDRQGGTLSVELTLPEFTERVNACAESALQMDTPLPEDAKVILKQAADCCANCRLNSTDKTPVGRDNTASCEGFSPAGDEKAFDVLMGEGSGDYVALTITKNPALKAGIPVMKTPCGLYPSDLFIQNMPS